MNKRDYVSGQEKVREIILLETDKNKKGDLFNRRMYDVFHALGFGEPRYNIPKPGREIDLVLQHRTENRIALVECKAHTEKIGGADVNKFMGALDVERGKYEQDGSSVVGYFISQSGFKDTVYEQEEQRAKARKERNEKFEMILLGAEEIVQELVQGKVICSLQQAASAVKCQEETLHLCEKADLLASEEGWIWVLYYSRYPQQAATHVAFVYADGNQLLDRIAQSIIQRDAAGNAVFSGLSYIKAPEGKQLDVKAAQEAYFQYLSNELGEIQFEGMPADKEAGAVKVDLENIFVPLRFYSQEADENGRMIRLGRFSIEEVLDISLRAAILAKPGGGKSTLICRIALAYAYPARRLQVDDGLPDREWFPVYIRCRDLESNATKSIMEIIGMIVQRAEITRYQAAFTALVEDALQDGRVLLLIDGLDEISEERYRICFADQLRTFVATYPHVHLLVTSRMAGFRAVAGTIANYCKQYTIAGLEEEQIRLLSRKWHQSILGKSKQVEIDSDKLCDVILLDARIAALAENPLLLTTLLFVKRCVGYLPTKRCRLYEEMIKLLLVTWNAGAHDKLDMDETEPQLAFVAYCMMEQGQQKITRDGLEECIRQARRELPEILGYTEVSPAKFIEQVEERSSLLIQMGYEEDELGRMVATYEFSHLSFQEYLTAKAIVMKWTPDSRSMNLLKALKPHLKEEHWREVVPLAALLSGRDAQPLMEYLIEINKKEEISGEKVDKSERYVYEDSDILILHLANCIANEAPVNRELLRESILVLLRKRSLLDKVQLEFNLDLDSMDSIDVFDTIAKSKYGSAYREIVKSKLFGCYEDRYVYEFSDAWLQMVCSENENSSHPSYILQKLRSADRQDKITGALLMMNSVYHSTRKWKKKEFYIGDEERQEAFSILYQMMKSKDALSIYVSVWCIAWSGYGEADIVPYEMAAEIAEQLVTLWLADLDNCFELKRVISWAIAEVCMPGLDIQRRSGLLEKIEDNFENPQNDLDRLAAVSLAVITAYWSKEEAEEKLRQKGAIEQFHVEDSRLLNEMGVL